MRLPTVAMRVHAGDDAFRRARDRRSSFAAIPAAVLTGLAFSAPIMAFAATLTDSGNFNALFRFVITPLFLFSGRVLPDRAPARWLQPWRRSRRCFTASSWCAASRCTRSTSARGRSTCLSGRADGGGRRGAMWTFTRRLLA